VINRGGSPVYRQIANALLARIGEGRDYPPGSQLPAEPALAAEYEVGKDTIRDALAILRNRGIIATRRGYRAIVRQPVEKQVITVVDGQTVDVRMPDPDEIDEWGIGEGVPVIVIAETDGGPGQAYPADRYRVVVASAG
jgi:DNA-binding GntR family transcriptional regulator